MNEKGVIFLKLLISEFSGFFCILFDFYQFYFLIYNGKKGGYFPQEPRADMARDPCGCDMARKAMWQSHASPRGCVAGPRESTRTPGWRLCGERVTRLASDGPTG